MWLNVLSSVLLPAHDVRDLHLGVIDDHAEVIRRHAVGLADDEILHLVGRQHDLLAEHDIGKAIFLHRHGKAHDVRAILRFVFANLGVGQLPAGDR